MNIKVSRITTIFKNQLYVLHLNYDTSEKIYYYYMYDENVNIQSGQEITTNFSGDSDYSIQNQTNDLIQQNEDNNNFWKNVYAGLFEIDSGEVREIIEGVLENTDISNIGLLSGEEAILESLNGEPADFVISWNSTQYQGQTIIPSGEINFSKKVRDIPELESIIDWLHIIMGYTVIVLLISDIWFTILKTLGIATSIYDQQIEETERINGITNEYTSINEDTGTISRRIVKKRKL